MARTSGWWWAWVAMVMVACSGGHSEDTSCEDVSQCRAGSTCLNGFCVSTENSLSASADAVGADVDVLIIDGAGNTCEAQSCGSLPFGTQVTFRAGSAPGFRFTGWTGSPECTGTASDLVIASLSHDTHCTANYVRRVKVAGHTSNAEGGVTASSDTPFASCNGGVCEVDVGQPVHLHADERFGQRFTGWSGPGCGSATTFDTTVVPKDDLLCVASFVERIVVRGSAMNTDATIDVASEGAVCEPGSCILDRGGNAVLTAPVVPKLRFAGWSGTSGCVGIDPTLRFSALQQSESCLATYTPRVTVQGSARGAEPPPAITALSPDLYATCSGAACDTDVGGGVTLLASSAPGYRLTGWSGPGCEAATGAAVELRNVTADTQCVASYALGVAVLAAVVGAPGEVAASSTTAGAVCSAGGCVIDVGGNVTLTAPSPAGYRFLGWDGDEGCASSALTISFPAVSQSKTCYARFAARYLVRGTVSPVAGGTIAAASTSPGATCSADGCTLDAGGEVALTVTPAAGYRFSGWSGGGACTGTALTVRVPNVQGNTTCQANFAGRFSVAGLASPAAGGRIVATSDSGAATCTGALCQVDRGSRVSLTATASEGYRFLAWSGCPGANGTRLTLDNIAQDMACTASFAPLRFTVASAVAPADAGSVTASATTGSPECAGGQCTVDWGTAVTLAAVPAPGWRFASWSGCTTSDQPTLTLPNVRANATCQARFQRQTFTITAGFTPDNGGSVAIRASGTGASCSGLRCTVPYGGGATLTARPGSGWNFGGWSGCSTSMDPTLALTNLTADAACTANFTRQRFDVVGTPMPATGGAVSATSSAQGALCTGNRCTVNYGSSVTLTAAAAPGFQFSGWACPVTGGAAIQIANVTANTSCTAMFQRLSFQVTGSVTPRSSGRISVTGMSDAQCEGASCTVFYGGSVTFAASPAAGFDLASWSGACTPLPGDPTQAVIANVTAISTCTANFPQRTYRVVGTAEQGGVIGTPSASPGSCTTDNVCTVNHGGSVGFTAVPSSGYVFTGWSGACAASATNPLRGTASNVTAAGTCIASFRLVTYTVTAVASGPGRVVASSVNPTCSGSSACTVPAGTTVTLVATEGGSRFAGWTCSNGATSPLATYSVLANADLTCTARFVARVTVDARSNNTSWGLVSLTGGNPVCTGTSCQVDQGATITLTASNPGGGSPLFSGWGDDTATVAPCPLSTAPDQNQLVARFTANANADCVGYFYILQ